MNEILKPLVEKKIPEALYAKGLVLERQNDKPAATEYFRQAAWAGLKSAQLKYAQILLKEWDYGSTKVTAQNVIHWYEQAIASGSKKASIEFARLFLDKDPQVKMLAAKLLLPLQDKPDALKQLVQLIRNDHAFENDPDTAKSILEKADQRGLFPGSFVLASRLETGSDGFEKDPVRAINLYKKVVARDNDYYQRTGAMLKLANMYEHGVGAAKDEAAAFEWYKQAANAGNVENIVRMGNIYKDGLWARHLTKMQLLNGT
jgi:TPR repeat protein